MVTSPMTVTGLTIEDIPDGFKLAVIFVAAREVVEHVARVLRPRRVSMLA